MFDYGHVSAADRELFDKRARPAMMKKVMPFARSLLVLGLSCSDDRLRGELVAATVRFARQWAINAEFRTPAAAEEYETLTRPADFGEPALLQARKKGAEEDAKRPPPKPRQPAKWGGPKAAKKPAGRNRKKRCKGQGGQRGSSGDGQEPKSRHDKRGGDRDKAGAGRSERSDRSD